MRKKTEVSLLDGEQYTITTESGKIVNHVRLQPERKGRGPGYSAWSYINTGEGQKNMLRLIELIGGSAVEWKVFMYLVSMINMSGRAEVTQSMIGADLHIREEVVSRTIKSLVIKGIVRKRDAHFVLNPEYVCVGSKSKGEEVWHEAAEREAKRQERIAARKTAEAIAKTGGVNAVAFADDETATA